MKTKSAIPNPQSKLQAFRLHHGLSYQQLSDICAGEPNCSKSQIVRLLNNQIEDAQMIAEMRKVLAKNLPVFLFQLGFSAAEINRELQQIFTQGEYQPMINQRKVLPKDVCEFFGFRDREGLPRDPFSKSPQNRGEVFTNPALKNVVGQVIDAIKYQGFVCVVGDIGSGKTTVRALIEDELSRDHRTRLIFPETFDMNRVTPANISRAILEEFEAAGIPNDAVSRAKKVKRTLAKVYQDGMRVAIGFDECHRLNDTALSSLKNFLEMNSGGFQKYLGVVLFGQPSFEARLRDFRFREIVERITQIQMPEFSQYAADYLAHRLALVGSDIAELFDNDAVEMICKQARTPLALGNIVNSALIISKEFFKNQQVIGAAIRTKMYFAEAEPKAMKKKV